MQSLGVRVPKSDAEATRRRLQELGVLRIDLEVGKEGDDVVFPVSASCGPKLPTAPFDFKARLVRPAGYQDLLAWPKDLLDLAPRAFDQIGDIVIVKVPPRVAMRAAELGSAIRKFAKARAVFADGGVKEEFRVRDLERISGVGESLTHIRENGVNLWVDPAKAYFSPRLATERERVAGLVVPGEHLVDLFGGVAPLGVQAALKGARVDSVDLNPAAIDLARRNVADNKVEDKVKLHLADAKLIGKRLLPADRIVMNLPHGAKAFLDVAAHLAKPGATIHYHEILTPAAVAARGDAVVAELLRNGKRVSLAGTRVVRNYSPTEAHVVFDFKVAA
ncbi:MAG: class I SAM-dependent methyltransferase family protein [bacterium]